MNWGEYVGTMLSDGLTNELFVAILMSLIIFDLRKHAPFEKWMYDAFDVKNVFFKAIILMFVYGIYITVAAVALVIFLSFWWLITQIN